jgi:hypothetical protein
MARRKTRAARAHLPLTFPTPRPGGLREFPGGKVLEGESDLEGARREFLALPMAPSDRRYVAFRRDGGGKGGG